ncbi:hypothetical protein NEFER03_1752 [Nematocida sp. LUAm3]|nr:hypothetical protein NEFER03_1752 [Nematocida sp. LUAm3]KAI5173847.1 hypothetical protein NEFER02_0314 [Nematocida sp. LUAm2]KAI5177081.1 hypothetical protein NEFER01_0356 [Nematocida sp. LUAm1]
MLGEQKRIYREETLQVHGELLTSYQHSNELLIIPGSSENMRALERIPKEALTSKYVIIDEPETPHIKGVYEGVYLHYLLILKEKSKRGTRRYKR